MKQPAASTKRRTFMHGLAFIAFAGGCCVIGPRPATSAVPYAKREILPGCQIYIGNNP